jgi:hypothetical protein
MSKQPMPKQKDTKKPLFERCDVVRVMGVPSPLMLVIDVSKDTDLNDEFAVGVIYFHEGDPPPTPTGMPGSSPKGSSNS